MAMHWDFITSSNRCRPKGGLSSVIGHVETPTWRGDCDFRFPNDAIPGKRRVSQMTSRLGLSSSQGSREWTDGWGNRVRGSWRTSTDFLYHAPLGCLCATFSQIMSSLMTLHRPSKASPPYGKTTPETRGRGEIRGINNELQIF